MNQRHDLRIRKAATHALRRGLWTAIIFTSFTPVLQAVVMTTGSVAPVLPWDNWTTGYIGYTSDGSLTVDAGDQLQSSDAYIAYEYGANGQATITGAGSKWTNSQHLYLGCYGNGELTIEAGAQVNSNYAVMGCHLGITGTATITGAGSKWINDSWLFVGDDGKATLTVNDGGEVIAGSLCASPGDLRGNGTITATKGAILDADLRFDAAHGTQTSMTFGSGGTLNINVADGGLGAGYKGNGSLIISEGVAVASFSGCLGYHSGSIGTATVTGAGSTWTNANELQVGYFGSGTLTIEAGAQVSSAVSGIGFVSGSTGTATVTGAGSKWTTSNWLFVGHDGRGTLTVADGGEVTAGTLYASLGDLHGNGTITATQGAILDADLRFNVVHGTQACVAFGSGGTLNVNAAGGEFGVGYNEGKSGSLTVAEGVTITSSNGYLGYHYLSTGTAAITGAGSKWINSGELSVGFYGSGSLTIEAGAQVSDNEGFLGYCFGSGTATVTGVGSKWINSNYLYVGYSGSGTLTVADGGEVTAGTLYASPGDLHGNGTITVTKGALLDADLRFDAAHGTNATLPFGSGGTLKVNIAGGDLGVGYKRKGSLTICEGVTVVSADGYLGHDQGSIGRAVVTGTGSKWINSGSLFVGSLGNGALAIEEGAEVSSNYVFVGYYYFSTSSTAIVSGTGSKWTIGPLSIGEYGSGMVHIRNGGNLTASSISVHNGSLLTIDAGHGSVLRVGDGMGTITNDGKVRILVGPTLAAGSQSSPIAVATWNGSGTFETLGGTWDSTSHVFTTSQTLTSVSGTPVTIDLAQRQRVLVEESQSGWKAGASLLAKTGTGTDIVFTATAVRGDGLAALLGAIEPGQIILNAWDFTGSGAGYNQNDPIYLSLGVGQGYSRSDLHLRKYDGEVWQAYSTDDLTYQDGYISFTVTELSGYAVTAVPEPSTVVLLIVCAAGGIAAMRRRLRLAIPLSLKRTSKCNIF